MRHTEGIGFGLLPTPLASVMDQTNFQAYDLRMQRLVEKGHKPFTMTLDQMALRGLLPTPTAMDSTSATAMMKSSQVKPGSMHSVTLTRWATQMLHTPKANDFKNQKKSENWKGLDLSSQIKEITGSDSLLNPPFVLEMMGFPIDWTELPFQNGEMKQ